MTPSVRPERDRHPVRLPLFPTGSGLAAWWGGDTLSQMAVVSTTHKIYNTRGIVRMKANHTPKILVLCVMVTATLAACGSVQGIASGASGAPGSQEGSAVDLDQVQGWLTQVAWSAAGIPVIGPLVTGILQEVAPQDHWCVGAVLIWLILSALSGGSGASGRS
jgi:uncharacterized protein YceK